MANYVKISTIGPSPLAVDENLTYQEITDLMITRWQDEFAQVLPDAPDLILVPEVCDRPSNLPAKKHPEYYNARGEQVLDFFSQTAKDNNCYIAYSAVLLDKNDNSWKNSTVILDRQGKIAGRYNKNFLVIPEHQQRGVAYGTETPIIECDFGTVGCVICYDLNFNELLEQYAQKSPDVLLFSTMYHGGLMQPYWAYSCRCHFVSAFAQEGPSEIRNPLGEVVAKTTNYHDYVTADINLDCKLVHLDGNGSKLRDAKKKYGSGIKITDPGFLGAVLLSCEMENMTVNDIIAEYNIELLDDYFNRSREVRNQALKPEA